MSEQEPRRQRTAPLAAVTPRDQGLAMPAEWVPHERTLMAWPVRAARWGDAFEQAKADYAHVAQTIAAFEPVLIVAPRGHGAEVRNRCGAGVDVLEAPLDDAWLRDNGPVFLLGPHGRRAAADFRFNGCGERCRPFEHDAQLTERICAALGIARYPVPLVLEGGAITVDGIGTLITTEQCLLHSGRNPTLDRDEIEGRLRAYLGVERIIWLDRGLVEDHATDGHVDSVCQFLTPGRVLLQTVADEADPNAASAHENRRRLEAALDVRGQHLEVVELDLLPRSQVDGRAVVAPYTSLYHVNGGVIVPLAGLDPDQDADALTRIADACPGREVVGVPSLTLALAGRGLHCITQQQPRLRL